MARDSVRAGKLLIALALMTHQGGTSLQAQVGISSQLSQVTLVVRAATHATMPIAGVQRELGRRGKLREAAVQVHLLSNRGYRLVVRSNAGATSRVWIHVANDEYQELIPGRAVTLSQRDHDRSERQVRYLTDGKISDFPVHFEVVLDPVI